LFSCRVNRYFKLYTRPAKRLLDHGSVKKSVCSVTTDGYYPTGATPPR
jgi:hypothetical protein